MIGRTHPNTSDVSRTHLNIQNVVDSMKLVVAAGIQTVKLVVAADIIVFRSTISISKLIAVLVIYLVTVSL